MRKLLSRVVHFTLRSGQHVTCADCVSLCGRLSRTDFYCAEENGAQLNFEDALQTAGMGHLSVQVDRTSRSSPLRGPLD